MSLSAKIARNLCSRKTGSYRRFMLLCVSVIYACTAIAQDEEKKEAAPDEISDSASKPMQEETIKRTIPNLSLERQKLLSMELDDGAFTWLESGGEKFIALWEPDKSGMPLGAVLFVHGEGQNADWPNSIRPVRRGLSDFGWSTLSIALPEPGPNIEIPPRIMPVAKMAGADTTESENADGDSATNMEGAQQKKPQQNPQQDSSAMSTPQTAPSGMRNPEIESKSNQHIQAALQFLNNKGQYNIVIVGHGIGAARATKFASSLPGMSQLSKQNAPQAKALVTQPIRGLVYVNARNSVPDQEKSNIVDYFSLEELPILDIYFGQHYLDAMEAKQRAETAKKNRLRNYYQVRLLVPSENMDETYNRVTRRIRGFLNRHAKGVRIESKK